MSYATNTSVSADKSRTEIETTLRRYGADQFMYATSRAHAAIAFTFAGKQVRFTLPLPDPTAREFTHTPQRGTRRSPAEADRAWEQAVRSSWRSLALIVKAKLEATESGIVTFEQEFAMHMVMPDGRTFSEHALPAIEHAYQSNGSPALALDAPRSKDQR